MAKINPIDHPICFSYPLRMTSSAWITHVPFGMFIIDLLRPSLIVELGTFSGVSYCSFCQAAKELKINLRAYAIDTWQGDPHGGYYSPEVLKDLRKHHDPLYGDFSKLIQSNFDDALEYFMDNTIDLLHIDGYHTYDVVKHDFETWLPKINKQGVVLLHDINVRERDFGVWRFWEDLREQYKTFEFIHGNGLGLVIINECPEKLLPLLKLSGDELINFREFFYQLGRRLEIEIEKEQTIQSLKVQVSENEQVLKNLSTLMAEKDQFIQTINAQLADKNKSINELNEQILEKERRNLILNQQISDDEKTIQTLKAQVLENEQKTQELKKSIGELEKENAILQKQIDQANNDLKKSKEYLLDLYSSFAWKFIQLIWHIRLFFAPHGSIAENVIKAIQGKNKRSWKPSDKLLNNQSNQNVIEKKDANELILCNEITEVIPSIIKEPSNKFPSAQTFDIICLPIINWEYRFQRPQHLCIQLAHNGCRIFYGRVEGIARKSENDTMPDIKKLKDGIWEFTFPYPDGMPFNIYQSSLNEIQQNKLLNSLRELSKTANIQNAVILVDFPNWGSLAKKARELFGWKIIYDCMEDHGGFSAIPRDIVEENEKDLAKSADMVIAVSEKLKEKLETYNTNTLLVRNAVEFIHFRYPLIPVDPFINISHPIIGYFGVIAEWFDLELIEEAAGSRPNWNFVLIGEIFHVDTSKLEKLPNVHFLGEKSYNELPKFANYFDVAIIPHKQIRRTEWAGSVKLYEYLATGRPVVSVMLEWLKPLKEYVYLSDSTDTFITSIEKAMKEDTYERQIARINFAKQNSWEKRASEIMNAAIRLFPKVSILILTHNNLEVTKLCLESISKWTDYPNYEIIVVDNASSDGTIEYLAQEQQRNNHFKVIFNDVNVGFSRGNNQAIDLSSGEYIVLLNNDCIVTEGWLTNLIKKLDDPMIGAVGPVTNFSGNESRIEVPYHDLDEMHLFAHKYTREHSGESFEIKMLTMFCIAMRRDLIDRIGKLDERYGMGMFEDDDFSLRIRQAGYKLICIKDVFIHHFGNVTFRLFGEENYRRLLEENRKKFEEKWGITWQPH